MSDDEVVEMAMPALWEESRRMLRRASELRIMARKMVSEGAHTRMLAKASTFENCAREAIAAAARDLRGGAS